LIKKIPDLSDAILWYTQIAGHMERYDWRNPDAERYIVVGYLQDRLGQRGTNEIHVHQVDRIITSGPAK
jgi:hypothetical protein